METEHQILKRLVETPSPYYHEQQISDVLLDLLSQNRFNCFTQDIGDGRRNIFASKGSGTKSVLFYGHMDTVNLYNEEEWETPPLRLTLKGSKYFGLGVADMKGGISSIIEATGNTPIYTKLFFAVDEENISEGTWRAVQDSETRKFFDDVELVISAEPNGIHDPAQIVTGRTGRSVYEVDLIGRPEHIFNYRSAIDAIHLLGIFIQDLYQKRETLLNSPESVIQIRKIEGESEGLSVCGKTSAVIEALLGPNDTTESTRLALQGLTNFPVKVKPRKTPYLQGYHFLDFPYKAIVDKLVVQYTGRETKYALRSSVGDDNIFGHELKIPTITWGPIGGNEHRPNEYVEIESLASITRSYRDFLAAVFSYRGY